MDFHNRQYDPQLGRFTSVDPLAAATANMCPHTGMNNDPVSTVDPMGLQGLSNLTSNFPIYLPISGIPGPIALPIPKIWIGKFVAKNSSTATSLSSWILGNWKKPINYMRKRRLYTHSVNGSVRYASTWGKYLGRWTGRVIDRVAMVYTIYDITVNVAYPMSVEMGKYQEANRESGDWISNLAH